MESFKVGGKSIPKPAVYASIAASLGILGYAYWMRKNATPAVDENAIPTDSSIDPSTGLPYADEFGGGMNYSGQGVYDPTTGGYFGTGYGTVTQVTTNAAWAQAATLYLTGIGGYDQSTVTIAIGKALTGQPMTQDEVNIFSAARAYQGDPPTGFPPINLITSTGGGNNGGSGGDSGGDSGNGGGGGGGGTTPTPHPAVSSKGPVSGLHATGIYRESISVDWNPISRSKGYVVYLNGQRVTTSVYTKYHFPGLTKNKSYKIGIAPLRSDGSIGTTRTITVKTKK